MLPEGNQPRNSEDAWLVQELVHILLNHFLTIGDIEEATKCGIITSCRVFADFQMSESELVCFEQVFTEFLAEVYRYLSTCAMALHKITKVLIHNVPFLVLPSTFLLIVSEEVALHLLMVKKVKLFVDERSDSHATYGLGSLYHRAVELPFGIIPRFGKYVDAKIYSLRVIFIASGLRIAG